MYIKSIMIMQNEDTLSLCNILLSTCEVGAGSRFYIQSSSSYDSCWFTQIIQLVLSLLGMLGSNT